MGVGKRVSGRLKSGGNSYTLRAARNKMAGKERYSTDDGAVKVSIPSLKHIRRIYQLLRVISD